MFTSANPAWADGQRLQIAVCLGHLDCSSITLARQRGQSALAIQVAQLPIDRGRRDALRDQRLQRIGSPPRKTLSQIELDSANVLASGANRSADSRDDDGCRRCLFRLGQQRKAKSRRALVPRGCRPYSPPPSTHTFHPAATADRRDRPHSLRPWSSSSPRPRRAPITVYRVASDTAFHATTASHSTPWFAAGLMMYGIPLSITPRVLPTKLSPRSSTASGGAGQPLLNPAGAPAGTRQVVNPSHSTSADAPFPSRSKSPRPNAAPNSTG